MSFIYDPKKLLNKIAPRNKVEKLISKRATLKKTALSFVSDIDFLNKKKIETVALNVIKGYKKRIKEDRDEKSIIIDDPKHLIQQVQNEVVMQIKDEIKDKYDGRKYIWLPSDAEEPDPEHQLKYGLEFIIGEGEMPGDRPGCRCAMEIKGTETQLEL